MVLTALYVLTPTFGQQRKAQLLADNRHNPPLKSLCVCMLCRENLGLNSLFSHLASGLTSGRMFLARLAITISETQ